MNNKSQSCGVCRHFKHRVSALQSGQSKDTGQCRWGPPCTTSHLLQGKPLKLTTFPIVTSDDEGCSKFEPAVEVIDSEDA